MQISDADIKDRILKKIFKKHKSKVKVGIIRNYELTITG